MNPKIENMYYKIYQSIHDIDVFYVDNEEGMKEMLSESKIDYEEASIENFPVIEPILMSEQEFNNLPEFTGF
jgi:hypothetical protein